jgi:hypothetical protein
VIEVGLKKTIDTDFGIGVSFWKVVDITISFSNKCCIATLNGYVDENARFSGKAGLVNRTYRIDGSDFETYFSDANLQNMDIRDIALEFILRTVDEFKGADKDVEIITPVEDVPIVDIPKTRTEVLEEQVSVLVDFVQELQGKVDKIEKDKKKADDTVEVPVEPVEVPVEPVVEPIVEPDVEVPVVEPIVEPGVDDKKARAKTK